MLVDITGDGKPELLCMSGGTIGYAEADWQHPDQPWKWHAVSPAIAPGAKARTSASPTASATAISMATARWTSWKSHGWWEQPKSLEGDAPWTFHEAMFGGGGAQMYGYDVNGDGKTDVITSPRRARLRPGVV